MNTHTEIERPNRSFLDKHDLTDEQFEHVKSIAEKLHRELGDCEGMQKRWDSTLKLFEMNNGVKAVKLALEYKLLTRKLDGTE